MKQFIFILYLFYFNNVIKNLDIPEADLKQHELILNSFAKNKKLEKVNDFENYMKEISVLDCPLNKVKIAGKKTINHILCPKALEKLTLRPIGKFKYSPEDFYNYINSSIYEPLGYEIEKKNTYNDLLNDLIFLNDKFSLIKGKYKLDNFESFNQDIGEIYSNMAEKTEDLKQNKGEISDSLIKILKKFHIFWNTLRNHGNIDKLKTETIDVLKNISNKYLLRQKNLTHITINVMDKIKESYYKFLRAHKMIEILKLKSPQMIITQIIKRYESVIDNYRSNNMDNQSSVQEISIILDLVKSFYVVNYRNNVTDQSSKSMLNKNVVERIKEIYVIIFNYLNKDFKKNKELIKKIKYFTATLILKIIHRTYIMFDIYQVSQYINMPKFYFENDSTTNIKVYYEFLDNMILIPEECLQEKFLKECTQHEVNRIITYLNTKYQIVDSVSGHQLITFLNNEILNKVSTQNFDNIQIYKKDFYKNLSLILKEFRNKYFINDLVFLENLESKMGSIIEGFKNKNRAVYEKSIGELDKAMYDQFIELKARYNNINIKKIDQKLIEQMKKELLDFIDNFEEENKTYMNHITLNLMETLRSNIEKWNLNLNTESKTIIIYKKKSNNNDLDSVLTNFEINRLQKRRLNKNFKNSDNFKKFKKYPSVSKFSTIKENLKHF